MTRESPRAHPWLRYLRFWGADVEADVEDELRFHLDMRAREYEARGMPPEDARRLARERFGDVDRVGDALRTHDRRRERGRRRRETMSDLTQDLRYGLRGLRRAPAFTLIAALTLALGIGATTAIFSVLDAVVLAPLPYPEADRLAMVWMDNRRMNMHEDIHSWANYADYKAQNTVFADLAALSGSGFNITGDGEPERINAAVTTANLFPLLGVRPALGRAYGAEEEEPGKDAVVVLSHGLWQRRFGGDPGVVGKTIRLNGRERTVLGVMPKGFTFPGRQTDIWVPAALPPQARTQRFSFGWMVVGRLKPGVPFERARREMDGLAKRLETEYPELRDYGVNLVSLPEQVVGKTLRTALWVMLGAVAAVLLIACANVANLQLSRAAARGREVGVRIALGASRIRLVRQLLTESLLLAAAGGALGVLLAWVGLRALTATAPADIPRLDQVRIDHVVLGVTLAVSLVTGVLFGLVPALQLSRPNLSDSLREGGRGGSVGQGGQRLRRLLVGAQMALVLVLLSGAGLLIRSFVRLQQVQLGFRPDHLLTMRLSLPGAKYREDAQIVAFYDQLLDRVRAIPGVRGVGAISSIFLSTTPSSTNFSIEGRARTPDIDNAEVPLDAVSLDYFKTMGIPLKRGRAFTAADRQGAPPVVMINENMARHFWPNEDPVGRRISYGNSTSDSVTWMTIVGVVGDMHRTALDAPIRYETFLPQAQAAFGRMTLVVRTAGEPIAAAAPVRTAVRAVDTDQPVFEIRTVDDLLSQMVAQRRFSMTLLATFALLALVLGLVGIYGVTSYLVAQRTREVGLRLALGAQPRQLVRMVVRQGMTVAAAGLGVGLVGALLLTRLMRSLLYEVSPFDVVTLAAVTVLLAAVTLVANWLPARRAAKVDPLVALRAE